MGTVISHSAEETERHGESFGRRARAGMVFGLTGDLGAGKTQWVRGFARGLGIRGRIQSPSFGLVNEYRQGRLPLAHLDLYRLETPAQILGAGLEDYLSPDAGVSVIEWYERWTGSPPTALVRVTFTALEGDQRRIDHDEFDPAD